MENQGFGHPSTTSGVATTAHPERDLEPGNPNMVGAAPPAEKKGIADKVKGLLGGHGHKSSADAGAHHQPAVYGDATPTTGTPESTKVGCLNKIKAKAGVGHAGPNGPDQGHGHGARGLLHSVSSSSSSSSSDEENITVGHSLDPSGPVAGSAFGRDQDHFSAGYTNPAGSASPDFNGGMNLNSSAAVHGGWPHPTNPNQTAGVHGGAHPTNPTGTTNPQGGAVLADHHGNLHEGPRDDNVKKEGFVSKIMDKLHNPKGKHANPTSTTATTQ